MRRQCQLQQESTPARTVFLHVFSASIAEHLRGYWCGMQAVGVRHQLDMLVDGQSAVATRWLGRFQTSRLHLFETNSQHHIRTASLYDLFAEEDSTAAAGTCIIQLKRTNSLGCIRCSGGKSG